MYTRKVKRKCGVRGCRNTVSYALSKTREMGNSVIICEDCLTASVEAIKEAQNLTFKEATPVARTTHTEAITEEAHTDTPTEDKPTEDKPTEAKKRTQRDK